MNDNLLTEKEIRRMLDRWYEAESTPREEQQLIDWFASTSADELPADLRGERLMFLPLRSSEVSEAEAGKAVDAAISCAVSRSFGMRLRRVCVVAASVAVVVIAIGIFTRNIGQMEPQSLPMIAADIRVPETAGSEPEEAVATPVGEMPVKTAPGAKKQPQRKVRTDENGYRQLSPEQAAAELKSSLAFVSAAFKQGEPAMASAENVTREAVEELRIVCCDTRRDIKDARKMTEETINEINI